MHLLKTSRLFIFYLCYTELVSCIKRTTIGFTNFFPFTTSVVVLNRMMDFLIPIRSASQYFSSNCKQDIHSSFILWNNPFSHACLVFFFPSKLGFSAVSGLHFHYLEAFRENRQKWVILCKYFIIKQKKKVVVFFFCYIACNDYLFVPTGIWQVALEPVDAGGPYSIYAVSEGSICSLKDVLFGDIWLCGGQSNMLFTTSQVL